MKVIVVESFRGLTARSFAVDLSMCSNPNCLENGDKLTAFLPLVGLNYVAMQVS